jgi:hypothetical protein
MTPALSRTVLTATAHLSTRTMADASAAECRACMALPAVRRLEARILELIATEDVLAVQHAYQALARTYTAALHRLRQAEAA